MGHHRKTQAVEVCNLPAVWTFLGARSKLDTTSILGAFLRVF
jgi:hypothetical protein